MAACTECGKPAGMMMSMCASCFGSQQAKAVEKERSDAVAKETERRAAEAIVITTAPSLEGYQVVRTIDIVTSECVFGMNMFRDFFTGMSDLFGGRSETTQTTLRDARAACLYELRREAHRVGANAVIAVDLDYSEFTGQGKSMLFLVASGTGVVVEPRTGLGQQN